MKYLKQSVMILCVGVLSACSTTTTPLTENISRSEAPAIPEKWNEGVNAGEVGDNWIVHFNDPVLTRLVKEANKNNRNLKVTAAKVERAQALNRQAASALKPQANLNLGAEKSGQVEGSSNPGRVSAGLQVSWEADVWGKLASGTAATAADLEAQQLQHQFAQSSLAASVARSYFLVKEAQQQVKINKDIVDTLQNIQRVVELQFQEGMVSHQDLGVAESDLADSKEQLAAIEKSERDAERSLELLLGRYPGADLSVDSSLPKLPPEPPVGLPAEILERRPDLIAAERGIATAFNRVNEAKAARLPRVNLTGNVDGASTSLSDLLDPVNLAWRLGTSLLTSVFDGGRLKAEVAAANASQKAAIAAYGQKALEVLNEVETQLDENHSLSERQVNLKAAYISAKKAYEIAHLRHEAGEITLLELSQIQQRMFSRRSQWVLILRQQLEARVNLFLALGGDWNETME